MTEVCVYKPSSGSRAVAGERSGDWASQNKDHTDRMSPLAILKAIAWFFLLAAPGISMAQQVLVIDINVVGLNVNQETARAQLDEACNSLNGNTSPQAASLQEVCDLIDTFDEDNPEDVRRLQEIADIVAPEEAFAVNDSLVTFSDYQTTNVHARLNVLRNAVLEQAGSEDDEQTSSILNDFGPASILQSGGGASSDLVSRLGAFINGHVSSGTFDGAELQQDSDISSSSLTFGADYRFGDNVVAGLGLGFLQDESTFSNVIGGAESDGFNLTAYATWYEADKGYLDFVLDFGSADYDQERAISLTGDSSLIAASSPSSSATSITVSGGRNFKPFGVDLGGYFRLSLTRATVDAYSETLKLQRPGFAALYSIGEQSVASTKMVLGFELSKAISTSYAIVVPLLRLEYVTENESDKENIEATLITTGTVAQFQGEDRVTGYSNLGIGASAVFQQGRSIYAYYETHLQHDLISQNWLKAGIRLEF
ncbi:MAG: autotransporter outer membrane beta-barrel domain-containing protein [Granulosicoccus sp.]